MKIVILDGFTANPGDLSWKGLEELGTLTVYDRTRPEETVARAADVDIVLTNKVIINREVMAQLPQLKYIGVLATGYNVVDIEAAHEHDIIVTNVPAYSTESVAQMVFAHLLTVTNRTEHYALQNRQGRWTKNPDFCYWDFSHMELAGKTFGIVGLGNIGRRVAEIALAFGMQVKALTSKSANALPAGIEKADLEELLASSDIISLHCPLTDSTRHLINRETLSLMRPSAILINTGRGPLVDDQAVAYALAEGQLAAFCADVRGSPQPSAASSHQQRPSLPERQTTERRISMKHRILFICHGNICRSPMAEFVMKDLVSKAGLDDLFYIESAATSTEEIGNEVYPPAKRKLAEHGISCKGKTARQMTRNDYDRFDLLIGMDAWNIRNMNRISGGDPEGKIRLLLDYTNRPGDVADPWYTGDFEATWRDVIEGCTQLLKDLTDQSIND